MMYELHYSRKAVRYLEKLPPHLQRRIHLAIQRVRTGNEIGMDIKKMKGTDDTFRLRLGNLRVVYMKFDDILVVNVIDINTRGDI